MLPEGKAPTMERSLNYDGKTYFVRFPKDLTENWKKTEERKSRFDDAIARQVSCRDSLE